MCALAAGTSLEPNEEWLITDQRGGFAMGTVAGVRTRKYHGFYLGIAGRAETAYLADLGLRLNGKELWPHRYTAREGAVVFPDPLAAATAFSFEPRRGLPSWRWELVEGSLTFGLVPGSEGGIGLRWKWGGKTGGEKQPVVLEVRPFWAMRPLHAIGGEVWTLKRDGQLAVIESALSQQAFCRLEGEWEWREAGEWYRGFDYSEERARGYEAIEDLYSAGAFKVDLSRRAAVSWFVAADRTTAETAPPVSGHAQTRARPAALEFVLQDPAGICAGFPWFGEWGRDTFVSLPGIAVAWIQSGGDAREVWAWAREILSRWGEWIRVSGMIPNLVQKEGLPQWESADGTLWWCHALASLWAFSLSQEGWFGGIESEFLELLSTAIASIRAGHHRFLKLNATGLLEVTEPHTTWMDARVEGVSVTPRTGALPEINALWFQALCLQRIWSRSSLEPGGLERLGRAALKCRELDRPNTVFLHSVPLAPSFVLRDTEALSVQLLELGRQLCTPVGLRTLSAQNPAYRPRCVGDQRARDLAYHQGPPWAWLGGHYQMARARTARKTGLPEIRFAPSGAKSNPGEWSAIRGQAAELFDAEPPFVPRGTPAQAWSVACFEEAAARQRFKIDAKVTQLLAQRWLDHLGQPPETATSHE